MSQTSTEVVKLIQEYVNLYNEQNYEAITEVVSESFVHETPVAPGGEFKGPEGVENFVREVTAAFPDFEATIVDSLVSGDRAMIEIRFRMTHEGEFNGIPPTGESVDIRSLSKVEAKGGELQRIREYVNLQDFAEQVGAAED